MGLTAGVAIVTAAEVGAKVGEAGLSRPDEDDATIANACVEATNYLILRIRGDTRFRAESFGYDLSKLSNTDDLKIPAAWLAAWIRLGGLHDEETQKRAAYCLEQYEKWLGYWVPVWVSGSDNARPAPQGLPLTSNPDGAYSDHYPSQRVR